MDPMWLLLLLPTAAAGGWIMAVWEKARTTKSNKRLPEAYFKGLSFLLNEQPDKALQVFLEAVEVDSETVEIHMALGSLFRRRGEIERATRIHQNLVARSDLEQELRSTALFELAQDYFKAGLFDRAENLFQELKSIIEYHEQACRFLLQIYDQEKEWLNAIAVAKELHQLPDRDLSESMAQYHCELAEKAISEGNNDLAERHLELAFQCNAHCVRAVIQSGRVASMRGNHNNAIAIWRGLEYWAADSLGEVVSHIANSYQELGNVTAFKLFLESALEENADSRIITALVELTRQQHGEEHAQTLLLNLIRKYPNLENLYQLIKSKSSSTPGSRADKDFSLFASLLSQVAGTEREYHCRKCGFNSNSLHWQCPGCKSWGTVQKKVANKIAGSNRLGAVR